jgi:hypothetical protein
MKPSSVVLLLALFCFLCVLVPVPSSGEEIPRDIQWSEDLDYLLQRLEITHPSLYANISKETFLAHAEQLREQISSSSDIAMVFGVQELVARIKNTHTVTTPVIFTDAREELKKQFQFYPVRFYPFEDGLYVLSTVEVYKEILGKKVVKLGKLTSEEAMKDLARFVSADNNMTILGNIPRWFLNDGQLLRYIGASDSPERMTLSLENDDGNMTDFVIKAIPMLPSSFYSPFVGSDPYTVFMNVESTTPTPLYMTNLEENYWFQYLADEEAIYLQINNLNNAAAEPFAEFCQRMFDTLDGKKAKKLVIDLRLNIGGDHIELPLLKGILARPHIDRADRLSLITGAASDVRA